MNNSSKRKFIEKVDFFKSFSSDELNNICSLFEYKEFETGRPLCNYKIIPNEIYLIIEGEARLIYFEDNIPNTLGKIKSGEWVGLLSFLRFGGCEEISAISQLKVFSIKDKDILNLIKDNNSFRNKCLNKIWLAEIIELVKIRITESPSLNQNIPIKQIAEKMIKNSRLVPLNSLETSKKNKNEKFFIASSNFDRFDIGKSVLQDDLINETESVLPKRLIAWREDKFENICKNNKTKSKSEELPQNSNLKNHSEIPINTGLELGKTQENQLTLIKGIGELEEATACFKMLSKQLEFPYRRDAIESILRDHVKRGRKIDLQVCGNIALMMGLRVEGIKVNSSFGCRLQTPSLLIWKDSISIASKSNSNGLTIASPRHGWITISEEEIIKNYPKEIDLIILGKDDNLKSNNFGFQ